MNINLLFPRLLLAVMITNIPTAQAVTAKEQATAYSTQAGAPGQASRGQRLFTSAHGNTWSCASCHTADPGAAGKHASTGKPIAPLAPAANPERFTDQAKSDKWFRRNCNDVMGRECTASEKADMLAWLLSIQR